jgi:hypothetical protein
MLRLATALLTLSTFAMPAAAEQVLTYHNSPARTGAYKVPGLTVAAAATVTPDTSFSATLSGHIYAQPLYWQPKGGAAEVIVATENNIVYALNATTGAIVWHTQLASPATSGLPCGNINPEGIDGAPVIDPATGTLYVNALTQSGSNFRHMVYALSLSSGAVVSGWPIDIQAQLATRGITFSSANQGERSGMLFTGGALYVVYGGKYGDCLPYHGTVTQIDPVSASLTAAWQTRASGGGIWAQGGIAAEGKSLFITTGNTFNANGTYGDGESIIRLAPPSSTTDYYAPANWQTLDNDDSDLGGTEALPVRVADGTGKTAARSLALGKDGNAYLVNRNNLGGVGGPATIVKVSNSVILTGPAVYSTSATDLVAFTNFSAVGCPGGVSGNTIMALKLSPSKTSPVTIPWCTAYNGNGSPIITTTDGTANPIVWVVGAEGDNKLHGYNALTGASLFTGSTAMSGLHHFQTLIVAGGHFYVAADNTVYAFGFTPG